MSMPRLAGERRRRAGDAGHRQALRLPHSQRFHVSHTLGLLLWQPPPHARCSTITTPFRPLPNGAPCVQLPCHRHPRGEERDRPNHGAALPMRQAQQRHCQGDRNGMRGRSCIPDLRNRLIV